MVKFLLFALSVIDCVNLQIENVAYLLCANVVQALEGSSIMVRIQLIIS